MNKRTFMTLKEGDTVKHWALGVQKIQSVKADKGQTYAITLISPITKKPFEVNILDGIPTNQLELVERADDTE